MFVRMSQAQGKMKLELLPTFTALDRSDMTKRRAPSAQSLPQPPTHLTRTHPTRPYQ